MKKNIENFEFSLKGRKIKSTPFVYSNDNVDCFEFYYRRKNKYFFRGVAGKVVVIETTEKLPLERGCKYEINLNK